MTDSRKMQQFINPVMLEYIVPNRILLDSAAFGKILVILEKHYYFRMPHIQRNIKHFRKQKHLIAKFLCFVLSIRATII